MKRPLRFALIVVGIYLVTTLALGAYAEIRFRQELYSILRFLGKPAFAATEYLKTELESDASLHRFSTVLKFVPPVGWVILNRMASVESAVIYGSRNYALPEPERFSNPEEARRFGYNPMKRSDIEVANATLSQVW